MGNASPGLVKAERIQIGILQHESESHGSALHLFHALAVFPCDSALDFVAEDLVAVSQCVTGNRLSFGVLDFDMDAAGR